MSTLLTYSIGFACVCTVSAVAADPPCTKCLPSVLKEMEHGRKEFCTNCNDTCRRRFFRTTLKNVAETDDELAKTLRDKFLAAADGSMSTAAQIFFSFNTGTARCYPDKEKMKKYCKAFKAKYPSLAPVFYKNFPVVWDSLKR